jgi:aerobic carbon-monoxide dehydrogenase small subunit
MKTILLVVNDKTITASLEPRTPLADFLRETLALTGTHLGCEHGVCGACTLLIDGVPARACITYAVACAGARVATIEGLDSDEITSELRVAFSRAHALQCGYCTPGMLVSARDVVIRMAAPSERDVRVAMSGNLCRCTGYVGIITAIMSVIESRRARGIVALPGAGRTALGPVGSGHAPPADAAPSNGAGVTARPRGTIDERTIAAPTVFEPQVSFTQSLRIACPPDRVWDFMGRVREVARCLPGALLVGEPTDRHVDGKIQVKLGPITAQFSGAAEIERDAATRSAIIRGSGRDAFSNTLMRGEISYRLLPGSGESTDLEVAVGYTLTGALAQFGRTGVAKDIANRLASTFVENLQRRLGQEATHLRPAAEIKVGALLLSILTARIKARLLRLAGR